MSRPRLAALAVLGARIAYGAALLTVPTRITQRWLGPTREGAAAQVALRGLAARELAIHGAGLAAVLRGAPVRPWLAVSIAGDLGDIAATFVSRRGLPSGSPAATAAVAGASAAVTAAVLKGVGPL